MGGYSREGEFNCRKDCPIGWPDEGSFCTKIGTVEKLVPFPWMPGDMALTDASVKRKAEFERQKMLKKEKARLAHRAYLEEQIKNGGRASMMSGGSSSSSSSSSMMSGGTVTHGKTVVKKVITRTVVKKSAPIKKFIRDL